MNWLVTIIIGGLVGWLGSLVMKTDAQMGLLGNIIVGIVGSSLGFWLAGMLGLSASGPIMGWVVAVAGAALLIFLLKAIGILKYDTEGTSSDVDPPASRREPGAPPRRPGSPSSGRNRPTLPRSPT